MKKIGLLMCTVLATMAIIGALQVSEVQAQETLYWSGWVYSSGSPATTSVLELGRTYRIEALEIFWYNFTPYYLAADAMYYTDSLPSWNWINHFPAPDGHSFLQIDNMDVNWGPFSNGIGSGSADGGHTYSINYVGQGVPITFRIVDWIDGDYSNNYCHLPVKIYATPRLLGLTPGFWKNHIEAWPSTYATTDAMRSVFGACAPDATLMEALNFGGGRGLLGASKILSRAAVAALLNAETFGTSYKYTAAQLIEMVSYQFCHGTRSSMLELATDLDYWNNVGVPPD